MRFTRREFFKKASILFATLCALGYKDQNMFKAFAATPSIPQRPLGKTGVSVSSFGLGGEGVLRTYGKMWEAVAVIRRALDLGVTYFDTAPAYAQSQDYYGAALKDRRKDIFLAAKTHIRTRDGSLRLLDDSLRRLKTDHLDLWQLHDVRTQDDIDRIFSPRGAIYALEHARSQKMVRFIGITSHYDPLILKQAIERYTFDTVMMPLHAADRHYNSFIETLLPVAEKQGLGIIAMKVLGRGAILNIPGIQSAQQAIQYALSLPISTAIVGCSNPQEVEENVRIAKYFQVLSKKEMAYLESLTKEYVEKLNFFKK